MAEKYTSIAIVMDGIMTHPMLRGLGVDAAVRYAVEFMQIMGSPMMYDEKVDVVKIENYRGKLPCDFYEMIQVRDNKSGVCYHTSTDSFHMSLGNGEDGDLTYKIQGGVIFTSEKNKDVEIAYKAILEDEDGFPLIPDNAVFIRALQSYIKERWFTILFDMGKINANVLSNAQQDYAFNAAQCHSEFVKISIDEAESITNMLNTALERRYSHKEGFVRNGTAEQLRKI